MAAAATALGTAELLETILRNLPTKDLLLAQRVSRFFNGCIDGSAHLQRALFFVPGDALDVHQEVRRFWVSLGRDIYYNPFEVTPDAIARLPKDCLTTVKSTGIRMNPLLVVPTYKAGPSGRQLALNVSPSFLSSSLPGSLLSTNESASCKRMYLSQPPMTMDHHVTYIGNGR
ncbi:putative F-box domain-containing protein [Septoria linicola]|nr:putative F-box domain-containing protein [Septoria linicola]